MTGQLQMTYTEDFQLEMTQKINVYLGERQQTNTNKNEKERERDKDRWIDKERETDE